MNKLLIFAGATISAIGLMAIAPAHASTRTFDFDADASVRLGVSPVLGGRSLGGVTLPNSVDVVAKDITGSFTALDDPALLTDGSLTLNYSLIDSLLSDSYKATLQSLLGDVGLTSASQALQTADDLFKITGFTGGGVLTSQASSLVGDPDNPSSFNIAYNSSTNSVSLNGYDTDVAQSCLAATCTLKGGISFGVSLVLSEFVTFTGDLLANSSVTLTPEARSSLNSVRQVAALLGGFNPNATLNLGTVNANLTATTSLASSNPSGSTADITASVTGGSLTATTTTAGSKPSLLFSRQFSSASTSTGSALTGSVSTGPGSSSGSGGTITLTSDNAPQGVPEPSMMLGFLGVTALLAKKGHQKRATR